MGDMIKVRYSDHLVIGTGIATQASFSRNSHNIVVWGMQSSIPQARSRVNEQLLNLLVFEIDCKISMRNNTRRSASDRQCSVSL